MTRARKSPAAAPPVRLGARVVPGGADVAVRSATATAIDVVVPAGNGEAHVSLAPGADGVWRGHVAGLRHGERYGLRVYGPQAPERGLRFDPSRLLLDPYARAIDGEWSIAVADVEQPNTGPRLRTAMADTVVYEAHVRGLTRLHPEVPATLRGTYAGLAHPAIVDYLVELGVTAIELLPVHEHRTEPALAARGLVNYWGYSPVGFLAPHAAYSASGARGGQVAEFRHMVRTFHEAGLEVLVDVVFNHTAEGGPGEAPMVFRGIDNPAWYVLDPHDPSRYWDWTGCGNTLDPESATVQEFVLEALRYWTTALGVDGFRFDLMSTLGRTRVGFTPDHPLLRAIGDDPVLRDVKLIAEPWDVAPGGYQVGGFPKPFSEWNGVYRDDVRDIWRGYADVAVLARRLGGSDDVYGASGRGPAASVNLITAHDGFTLADLVTYERKRNEANREGNRDGDDHNRAWNSGVEGPTDDPTVLDVRARRRRGMLATLLVSAGAAHLVGGDERGRTQRGNNNAYCQDNPISWVDWTLDEERAELYVCTRLLLALRRAEPLLRRDRFLAPEDVRWLDVDGEPLDGGAWHDDHRALAVRLIGARHGRPDLLLLFDVGGAGATFVLPDDVDGWAPLVDTSQSDGSPAWHVPATGTFVLQGWSVAVLRAVAPPHVPTSSDVL